MNYVKQFAKRGYDDKLERDAFRKMVRGKNSTLRDFIVDYCQLKSFNNGPYNEIDDPLGKCAVDMAIVDKNKNIVCLVEVDVFFSWKDEWPSFYKWCHRLERKEKYWINTPYPYINITFSANHKNGIVTTREIESQYPIIKKWFKQKKMWEKLREVPISSTIKVGEWA
tara:strand:+ start:471 stop:974 length:504 start_codon:yes stop_codon:yes gene_type:complete